MPKRKSVLPTIMPPRTELDEHVDEILALGRRSFEDIVEIGRRLVRCRELLKTQRGWLAWIKTKFGWSRAHADNLIGVYLHRDKLLKFSTLLPISALYLLAKQEPEVHQRLARQVEAGEPVNMRAVRVIVTHHDRVIRSVSYNTTPREPPPSDPVYLPSSRPSDWAADRAIRNLRDLVSAVRAGTTDTERMAAQVDDYEIGGLIEDLDFLDNLIDELRLALRRGPPLRVVEPGKG